MEIPSIIQKQMYTIGSLKNVEDGVLFSLNNPIADAALTGVSKVEINRKEVPLDKVILKMNGQSAKAAEVDEDNLIPFPMEHNVKVHAQIGALEKGTQHHISLDFQTEPFGPLSLDVKDTVAEEKVKATKIPCNKMANEDPEIVRQRQDFVEEYSGVKLQHINKYSFEPTVTKGNIENFTGVAQVPIGFAGPLKVNGQHAKGEFLIPLATSEGTLVASYNRGIKVMNMCGGVTTTVVEDCMQRAPVFVFDSAREALEFAKWIDLHIDEIRKQAESTSRFAKLIDIEKFQAGKFVYLRFNFTTGDAAGQNIVNMATFIACTWILNAFKGIRHFYLESNFATDKKASHINMLRTRGKRVTAEVTINRDVLIQHMRVDPETLHYHSQVAEIGSFMAGSTINNGLHSANAIAAMFIATGQDVANVAESSAAVLYNEVTPEGNLYGSLTLPSLIVGTYGGGTGLPTQRECLEILGCYGPGKVLKLAEIVAAVAIAGELSLSSAISSLDWVRSHEVHGKNR